MHKQLYEVPATFAAKARFRKDDYEKAYAESISDPEGFWGRMGQRIDWVQPYTKVKDVSFDAQRLPHPLVLRRQAQRLLQLPRPAPRHARRQDGVHLRRRRPRGLAARHVPRAVSPRLQARECAEEPGRAEGRPRHHLPADDSRSRRRDARVRAHRRDPFGGLRRLLAGFARRAASRTARRPS